MSVPDHIQAAGRLAVEVYKRALANGAGERFAEMAALRTPPGTKGTDKAFMEGRLAGSWLDKLPPRQARRMVREAQAAGINTSGKFYMGGLADKRGHADPAAWVDSVDDVRRVAKSRNLEVHGIVDYTPPEAPPPKRVDLAPDIVKSAVRKELKKNPGMKKADAVERVKKRHTPHWKQK
jgi:hypothetical protein